MKVLLVLKNVTRAGDGKLGIEFQWSYDAYEMRLLYTQKNICLQSVSLTFLLIRNVDPVYLIKFAIKKNTLQFQTKIVGSKLRLQFWGNIVMTIIGHAWVFWK